MRSIWDCRRNFRRYCWPLLDTRVLIDNDADVASNLAPPEAMTLQFAPSKSSSQPEAPTHMTSDTSDQVDT